MHVYAYYNHVSKRSEIILDPRDEFQIEVSASPEQEFRSFQSRTIGSGSES